MARETMAMASHSAIIIATAITIITGITGITTMVTKTTEMTKIGAETTATTRIETTITM